MEQTSQATSIGTLLRKAWEQWKGQPVLLTAAALLYAISQGTQTDTFSVVRGSQDVVENFSVNFGASLASLAGTTILTYVVMLVARNPKLKMDDLGKEWRLLIPAFVAGFLFSLFTVIGFILLIIPGIYIMLTYSFVQYLIVDKKLSIGEAFKKSKELAIGFRWRIFLVGLVSILVGISGLIFFGIGALVTMPIAMLMFANFYIARVDAKQQA